MAGISKAFLKKLPGMVKDPENLEAIKAFLEEHGHEIKKSTIRIIDDGLYFTGSVGPCTLFKLWGEYYIRAKTSINSARFSKDPVFARSRESAKRFAHGNQLASKLYGLVEGEKKVYKLFCFLKKRAIGLLKEGKTVKEAEVILLDYLKSFGMISSYHTYHKIKSTSCSQAKDGFDVRTYICQPVVTNCDMHRHEKNDLVFCIGFNFPGFLQYLRAGPG